MSGRRTKYRGAPKTGMAPCAIGCGRFVQTSQACCGWCWRDLPQPLKDQWMAARDSDPDDRLAALAAIAAHARSRT